MRFNTQLTEDEFEALVKLAQTERRDTRAQAAVLIREALEQRGLIERLATAPSLTPPTLLAEVQHG